MTTRSLTTLDRLAKSIAVATGDPLPLVQEMVRHYETVYSNVGNDHSPWWWIDYFPGEEEGLNDAQYHRLAEVVSTSYQMI